MYKLDFDQLDERFGIRVYDHEQAIFTMPAAHLLQAHKLRQMFQAYMSVNSSVDQLAAARELSSLMERVAQAMQVLVVEYNTHLDLSLMNLNVQVVQEEKGITYKFVVTKWLEQTGPLEHRRKVAWSAGVWDAFYQNIYNPVQKMLNKGPHLQVIVSA
ncbi:hypothetical protein NV379_00960 [Paenibacillus sp. N1-5-1-14]|uniref:hypothetical protein n=1 Tax=Paenibacillus radicibacter TaxID=2972488 RepID=UPI002158B67C|nr:hypothetical protein [Paenibacillus radicibacter]MCR8641213.1 hypothetical protein [Paenibacillus radicibacter]